MKVLYIGKYPPFQGGTACDAFWRIKALRDFGLDFKVLAIGEKDSEFCIKDFKLSEHEMFLTEKIPWHIPYSKLYSEQLVSKALQLSEKEDFDIVEGCYLFPFGFSAFVVSIILNKPLVIRHSGSDFFRLSKSENLLSLFRKIAQKSSVIVTSQNCISQWKLYGAKNLIESTYVPNPKFFFKADSSSCDAVFLGKITEKWDRKQLDFFYDSLKNLHFDGKIDVYSNDYARGVFSDYFLKKKMSVSFHNFLFPEDVPSVLRCHKFVLASKIPDGIPEESNLVKEALMCSCHVIHQDFSSYEFENDYESYIQKQMSVYKGIANG